jgi:membrane protein
MKPADGMIPTKEPCRAGELLLADLSRFPWRNTAHTLRERFREDQLGLTASSLTFTTSLALVPFFTVALACSRPSRCSQGAGRLQRWLVQSLIPDNIARQVLGYLTQFAAKASKLGSVGLAIVLVITALALILTIDRTLNRIWRVRRRGRSRSGC